MAVLENVLMTEGGTTRPPRRRTSSKRQFHFNFQIFFLISVINHNFYNAIWNIQLNAHPHRGNDIYPSCPLEMLPGEFWSPYSDTTPCNKGQNARGNEGLVITALLRGSTPSHHENHSPSAPELNPSRPASTSLQWGVRNTHKTIHYQFQFNPNEESVPILTASFILWKNCAI